MNLRQLGYVGETWAARLLESRGYTLLYRNWTMVGGEIDLVMRSPQNELVFVEVKTAVYGVRILPQESFTLRKRRFLKRAISWFLCKNFSGEVPWRLDLVCLQKVNRRLRAWWYRNLEL